MIIDVHGHLFRGPDDLDWIVESGVVEKVWLLAMPELPAAYRPDADAVIFGTDAEVLEAAKAYPDLFLPFGYLDFRNPPEAIRDQREAGMVGLKAIFAEKPYDDPTYMAHYEQAEALGMPILFHLGGLGAIREQDLGPGLSTRAINMRPSHLGTIAGNFPKLVCVGAHMGQSWHGEVLECIRSYANVYFDTSGGDTVLVMRWLLDHLGEPGVTGKVVTGIDAVYGRRQYHEDIAEKIRFWESFYKYAGHWFEWTDQAEKILRGNAAAIPFPS